MNKQTIFQKIRNEKETQINSIKWSITIYNNQRRTGKHNTW